jgi:hypothetical protein
VFVELSETKNKDSRAQVLSTDLSTTQPTRPTKLRHSILVSCYSGSSRPEGGTRCLSSVDAASSNGTWSWHGA